MSLIEWCHCVKDSEYGLAVKQATCLDTGVSMEQEYMLGWER